MSRRNFTLSGEWADYQRGRDHDARADRLAAQHTGGWCDECQRWIENAKTGDRCECGGAVEQVANPHANTSLARCPSGGGEAARWAKDERIPEWVNFGDHVFAYDLKEIASRCGVNVAASVDALCRPCEVCGLNTYGGGACHECELVERAHSKRGPAVMAELSGTWTPRCDF